MKLRTLTGAALAGVVGLAWWQGTLPSTLAGVLPGSPLQVEQAAPVDIDPELAATAAFIGVPEHLAAKPAVATALGVVDVARRNAQSQCDDLQLMFPGTVDDCAPRILRPAELEAELDVLHDALGLDPEAPPLTPEEEAAAWAAVDEILGVDPEPREMTRAEIQAETEGLWDQISDLVG